MTYPFLLNQHIPLETLSFYSPQISPVQTTLGFYEALSRQIILQKQCIQKLQFFQNLFIQRPIQKNHYFSPSKDLNNAHACTKSQVDEKVLNLKLNSILAMEVAGKAEDKNDLKVEEKEVSPSLDLKRYITHMLHFFIQNFGKIDQIQCEHERRKYSFHINLLSLFDALAEKYKSASKCREDMIRYVLRKALAYLRDSLRVKQKLTSKNASIVLCQKYFEINSEEMIMNNIDMEKEEDLLNFLLPYKKNSRNKTANNSFITELFASEAFYQDYLDYLSNFEEIVEQDNQRKINKFIDFLVVCVQENTIPRIKNFKRLPWLNAWLRTSKIIAHELLGAKHLKSFQKKQKRRS